MSNRFHSKYHRKNHHTLPLSGDRDSSHDPVASPAEPFRGTFVVDGLTMAQAISAKNDVHVQGAVSIGDTPGNNIQSTSNLSLGASNSAVGQHQLTVGTSNSVQGQDSAYIGTGNISASANSSLVAGSDNTLYGDNIVIGGSDNTITPDRAIVFGEENVVSLSSNDSHLMTHVIATTGYDGGVRVDVTTPPDEYVITIPDISTISVVVSTYTTLGELITADLTSFPITSGQAQGNDITYLRGLSSATFLSGSNSISNYWAYTCAVSTDPGIFGIVDIQLGNFTIYTNGISVSTVSVSGVENADITISYDYIAQNANTFNIGIRNTSDAYETFTIGADNEAQAPRTYQIGSSNSSGSVESVNIGTANTIDSNGSTQAFNLGSNNGVVSSANVGNIGFSNYIEDGDGSVIVGNANSVVSASSNTVLGRNTYTYHDDNLVYNNHTSILSSTDAGKATISAYGGVHLGKDVTIDDTLYVDNVYASYISAVSAVVNYQDILVSEISGFWIKGSDYDVDIPDTIVPGVDNLTLDGVGLSATSWATFDGNLETKNDLIVSGTATIGGGLLACELSSSNIYSCDPAATAINVWNNLDMQGYSISGIGNNSLSFESGAKISSNGSGEVIIDGDTTIYDNLTVTQSISAPALSGTFYGDGSNLTGVAGGGTVQNATTLAISAADDGGVVAGDARGSSSVDLQTNRQTSDEVASGSSSVVIGGQGNRAAGPLDFVGGGQYNQTNDVGGINVIPGGSDNRINNTQQSNIAGGSYNYILSADDSAIGGGTYNAIYVEKSNIAGGEANIIIGDKGSIAGGHANVISPTEPILVDSYDISAFPTVSYTISGVDLTSQFLSGDNIGQLYGPTLDNLTYSTQAGDPLITGSTYLSGNTIIDTYLGGSGAIILLIPLSGSGPSNATILGGTNNYAIGENSMAGGTQAIAAHDNSIVLATSGFDDYVRSTNTEQITLSAVNGVALGSTVTVDGTVTADSYNFNDGSAIEEVNTGDLTLTTGNSAGVITLSGDTIFAEDVEFANAEILDSATATVCATDLYLTLVVNGSALAIPLFQGIGIGAVKIGEVIIG